MNEEHIPRLVAHRGYMQTCPENTWQGLEAALKAGACWIEFDLQMCADGRFVLLHDADFKRTANTPASVFSINTEQLMDISVHEPARLGERYAPLPVSDLDTVLLKLTAFPNAGAMVEIKQESLERWGLERVMDALLEKLRPCHSQCALISYSHQALSYARERDSIDIGWVLDAYDEEHFRRANQLNPQFLICNERKIPQQETPWAGTWQWMLYDISDPARALQWATRGIELIETRAIGTMLQDPILARKACPHGI
ncbi:MAG: glycerophosphodiester phosphodiesterase family protein [Thiogranum sp.]